MEVDGSLPVCRGKHSSMQGDGCHPLPAECFGSGRAESPVAVDPERKGEYGLSLAMPT